MSACTLELGPILSEDLKSCNSCSLSVNDSRVLDKWSRWAGLSYHQLALCKKSIQVSGSPVRGLQSPPKALDVILHTDTRHRTTIVQNDGPPWGYAMHIAAFRAISGFGCRVTARVGSTDFVSGSPWSVMAALTHVKRRKPTLLMQISSSVAEYRWRWSSWNIV